ncbi:MAG: nitrogen fixation protein NifQ [Rhodospirillaceae bacterium]
MAVSDRVLFLRLVTIAAGETRPLTEALGLTRPALERLLGKYLPESLALVPRDGGPGEDALEEPDLRDFLLTCRAGRGEEEEWLAAIVARRSLGANHLWQDLGLAGRSELNTLFRRHFPELVRLNRSDMKWKKFFYRQLCAREGLTVCRAPNCAVCPETALCFGPESGASLLGPAALSRMKRGMSDLRQNVASVSQRRAMPTIGGA